jgi:hypothetical protein
MTELDKALADIGDIRARMAAGTTFQGFGPMVIAVTGILAVALCTLQYNVPTVFASSTKSYLIAWLALACVCALLIGIEMVARSRRIHGGLADAMLANAVEQFLPAAVGGIMLTVVIFRFQSELMWMLPGLWQLLLSVGLFASARNLVRSVKLVAGWYFVCSFVVLVLSTNVGSLSPLFMAVPFVIGQLMMALVLKYSGESHNE